MTIKPPKDSDNIPLEPGGDSKAEDVLEKTRLEDSTARNLVKTVRAEDSKARSLLETLRLQSAKGNSAVDELLAGNSRTHIALDAIHAEREAFAALLRSPMSDAIRKLHEENEALTRAFRSPLSDELEKLRINVPEFVPASFPSIPSELSELGRTSEKISKQLEEMTRASQATADLLRAFRNTYEPLTFDFKVTKQIAGIARDLAEQSRVSSFADIFEATRQAAEAASQSLDAIQASIRGVTSQLPPPSETADTVISVGAGAISISGGTVGLEVSEWNSIPDIQRSLHKLPLATQLFIVLFFVLVVRPILDRLVADYFLGETKTRNVTNVVTEVQQVFGNEEFEFLRCVRATTLNVREDPDGKSKTIGKLKRGQIVEAISHEGVWTYVRYAEKDSDDAKVGWVATAHLSRELCLAPHGKE